MADTKTKLVAYDALIRTGLEYGCQSWDAVIKKEIKTLEKVQNKAVRFVYNIKGNVSFWKLRDNTGISS